jgi:hypothetical protein
MISNQDKWLINDVWMRMNGTFKKKLGETLNEAF